MMNSIKILIKRILIVSLVIVSFVLGVVTHLQMNDIIEMEAKMRKMRGDMMLLEMSNISYEQYIQKKVIDNELIEITKIERE